MLLHPSVVRSKGLAALTDDQAADVEIRLARPVDAVALDRLTELDSRPAGALHGDVLMAAVNGDPVAALSLDDDTLVEHPFHHTKPLAQLLRFRAKQIRHA